MFEWWGALDAASKAFFVIASFFSVLFLWQLLMTMIGLSGSEGGDVDAGDVEADADIAGEVHGDFDAAEVHDGGAGLDYEAETSMSFKLLSLRSIIAFGMLFGWAGVLYRLVEGVPTDRTILYSLGWAFAGALLVSLLLYLMKRLQETGTQRLSSCVGLPGTVYMDIPAAGEGKVRTVVSGAVSFVRARGAAGGAALPAGTPVRVRRLLDHATVEVEKASE